MDGGMADPVPAEPAAECRGVWARRSSSGVNVMPLYPRAQNPLEAALRLVEKVNPVRFGDTRLPNSFDVVISTLQIIQHELGNVRAGEADLLIHPELHDYWVLEFWRAADIIERGRRASRGRASPDPGQDRGLPRKGRRVTRALAVLLVLAPLTIARAGTRAGVELADTVTVDGVTLVLNGMGLRQATRLRVRAFVGGLYLEQRTSDANTVLDSRQLKQVRLEFLRNIDQRNLRSGWTDSLRKIGGNGMDPSIAQFTALIPAVSRGDTMSFTWRPGAGIEVSLGDKVRGSVSGDEFARTVFKAWFGLDPGDAQLKRGMLGSTH